MKRIFICIAVAVVLYSCKGSSVGSPSGTVNAFIDASRKGNLTELKKYLTKTDASFLEMGESFLSKMDPERAKEMKEKMTNGFKEKTKDAKIEVKDEKIDGNNATVNVEFIHDGKSETRPFSLEKEDGQWKISLISTGLNNSGSTNKEEVQKQLKNMNLDSLKDAISQGVGELNKIDKDSLKKVMDEGLKEVEKLKALQKKN